MTLKEYAQKLRPFIEKAAKSLDDADALEAKTLVNRIKRRKTMSQTPESFL